MKLAEIRPYANPEAAARKLVELAIGVAPVQTVAYQRAIPSR
ncbi:hypothetical protein AB7M69_001428 [Bradyrhizobium japonicum]